jgi:hypothetical protein
LDTFAPVTEENPEEQEIMRLIRKLRDDGLSTRKIAVELNRQGRRTRRGSEWKCQNIMNILVNFTPLKPTEFVIIKISQIANQIQV